MKPYCRPQRSDLKPARNLQAVMLRLDGFTYEEIAEFTGCGTRSRAQQICHGYPAIEVGLILRAIAGRPITSILSR